MYQLPSYSHGKSKWVVYGSELSPFTLKLLNYLAFLHIPHVFYHTQVNTWQNIKIEIKKNLLVLGLKPLTWPEMSDEDEFPLVPFLFGPNGEALYDSTAIAHWLERQPNLKIERTLFPNANSEPSLDFFQHLIDDFFDDWGLYCVHHNRWKVACLDNNAGARLGNELRSLVGPFGFVVDAFFSKRQTRRLPYLFSVAPSNFRIENARHTPPSHLDFPETHTLLEESFSNILTALESIFSKHPFLFGNSYTLADASVYGQLGMNLSDPAAARWIADKAPNTFKWLTKLSRLDFSDHKDNQAKWHDDLKPLLAEISRVYLPLMHQNAQAYSQFKQQGQKQFNESAFWKNQAIFTGELDGTPFKSVAKSFQAGTWRELKTIFQALGQTDRSFIASNLHNIECLTA